MSLLSSFHGLSCAGQTQIESWVVNKLHSAAVHSLEQLQELCCSDCLLRYPFSVVQQRGVPALQLPQL